LAKSSTVRAGRNLDSVELSLTAAKMPDTSMAKAPVEVEEESFYIIIITIK